MITQIRAENFKSWKDTGELQLAPLTGLFGTNSSGKSSILQILLMLKQTAESSDRNIVLHTGDERSLVNLGTFSDLIYNHDLNEKLHISFSWKPLKPIRHFLFRFPPGKASIVFETDQISFSTILREDSHFTVVDNFIYEYNYHNNITQFGMNLKVGRERYEFIHSNYKTELQNEDKEDEYLLPHPIRCYGFPDETVSYYKNVGFLPKLTLSFENLFSRIRYLGPLRENPKRIYTWSGETPSDVGIYGERSISALLATRNLGLPIETKIEEWMQKTELLSSFKLKSIAEERRELFEVRVKKDNVSSEVLITDVGFGVSQILPVLVLCYYVPEGSIILLEQPEIHLHPSVQADLADVLVDVVMNRNVQIIVESHSEHLLRRLQRRIAEEEIPSDKVNLYFCEMENGASKIEKLELDEDGYIKNWPHNFFGDDMGDLIAMTEATIKRKEANT
jgi:predicted ATPase